MLHVFFKTLGSERPSEVIFLDDDSEVQLHGLQLGAKERGEALESTNVCPVCLTV